MSYTTKQIIELMEKAAQLGVSVEIKDAEFAVKIDGKEEYHAQSAVLAASAMAVPVQTVESVSAASPVQAPCSGTAVKSPIVGTYYGAPAPDKDPFVTVGKPVKKGDVIFIIESMKLMNEVQCECDGIVKEILVGNGQAVEFGQPVLILE